MHTHIRRTIWQLVLFVSLALVLAGCARPGGAGAIPDAGQPGTGGGEESPGSFDVDALNAALTATAQAAEIQPPLEQPTEDMGAGPLPTDLVPAPTVEQVAPTATPELFELPTATPEVAISGGVTLPTVHTVVAGEWIYSIARRYGVDPQAIINANPGINPNYITPGQTLNIPAPGGSTAPDTGGGAGGTHTVVQGENLFRIALRYGKTYQEVAAANNLPAPYLIYPGQTLVIP